MKLTPFFAAGHMMVLNPPGDKNLHVTADEDNPKWIIGESFDAEDAFIRHTRPDHVIIGALCWLNYWQSEPIPCDWLNGDDLDGEAFLRAFHLLKFRPGPDVITLGFSRGQFYLAHEIKIRGRYDTFDEAYARAQAMLA
jgi:hypothetical protein